MKTGTLIVGVALLVGLIYFSNLGNAAGTLQYIIQSVDLRSLTNWRVIIIVQNVSSASLTLNSMAGVVSVNGTPVGNVSNFSGPITIAGNSQTNITVNINPSLLGIGSAIYNAIQNGTGTTGLQFSIQGNVNVNNLVQSFSIIQIVNV
ncbi:MAG: hypothetical protein ACREOZ_02635 [Gloeomargaritales cyanobacterium]